MWVWVARDSDGGRHRGDRLNARSSKKECRFVLRNFQKQTVRPPTASSLSDCFSATSTTNTSFRIPTPRCVLTTLHKDEWTGSMGTNYSVLSALRLRCLHREIVTSVVDRRSTANVKLETWSAEQGGIFAIPPCAEIVAGPLFDVTPNV